MRTPEQVLWDWVTAWLRRAEDDLLAGRVLAEASLPSYETASFHAQQAAEKALKALLMRHQVDFTRTHDLGELLQLAEPVAPGIAQGLAAAPTLNRHAVDTRYPTGARPVVREEASRATLSLRRPWCGASVSC